MLSAILRSLYAQLSVMRILHSQRSHTKPACPGYCTPNLHAYSCAIPSLHAHFCTIPNLHTLNNLPAVTIEIAARADRSSHTSNLRALAISWCTAKVEVLLSSSHVLRRSRPRCWNQFTWDTNPKNIRQYCRKVSDLLERFVNTGIRRSIHRTSSNYIV